MSIFQGWSLKFIRWLGKTNGKKKYLMCQIPIKMLKQHATLNSSLHNLRIYSSKGCRKTSQRWIYVASYLPTNLANTSVSFKHSNFQQKISLQTDYKVLLRLVTSTFNIDTDEYYPVLWQFRRLAQGHCWSYANSLKQLILKLHLWKKHLAVYYLLIGDTSQVSAFFLTNKNE